MKRLVLSVAGLVLAAPVAFAAGECRVPDFSQGGLVPGLGARDMVFTVMPSIPANFTVSPHRRLTVSFRGHLCDRDGNGLSNVTVRLIRYESDLDSREIRDDDFGKPECVTVQETHRLRSSRTGFISATGLGPERWAIVVDWSEISPADTDLAFLDLLRTWGPSYDEAYGLVLAPSESEE